MFNSGGEEEASASASSSEAIKEDEDAKDRFGDEADHASAPDAPPPKMDFGAELSKKLGQKLSYRF